ncbi:adenylyltransferase/cytidyltransferase family protein [Streptomyces sp. SP18CS02]|uniref:adenylyltransferase/cytidyltransferase family protein n=1 Tax=Streptomyces sp. SP18CS02 TaxID=3002531 RepID=UPI003FCE3B02
MTAIATLAAGRLPSHALAAAVATATATATATGEVVADGCFDLLHAGHLSRLHQALRLGDAHGVQMPITELITAQLYDKFSLDKATATLMRRSPDPSAGRHGSTTELRICAPSPRGGPGAVAPMHVPLHNLSARGRYLPTGAWCPVRGAGRPRDPHAPNPPRAWSRPGRRRRTTGGGPGGWCSMDCADRRSGTGFLRDDHGHCHHSGGVEQWTKGSGSAARRASSSLWI